MHGRGPLTFGIAITGAEPWPVVRARAERLDTSPEIEGLWVFDERFERDAWISLGLLGGSTHRLRLGTCVTDALVRHPALTGTAIATLQEATGGRAILGLGAGWSGFDALGIERRAPATALRDAVTFLRRFWVSGTPVSFTGSAFAFHEGRLHHPLLEPVPIAIAGRGPRILELAGELADMVLVATFTDGPLLEHALERVAAGEARRSSDLAPLRRAAWLYIAVDEDPVAARAAVRTGIAVALWGSRPLLGELGIPVPDDLARLMDGEAYAVTPDVIGRAAALIPDDLIDACSVAGTAETCATRLGSLAERGFDHLALWPFPAVGQGVDDVVDRIVMDVIPRVVAHHPARAPHQGGIVQ
ncbi:MAG: LLM class flavin-dependent oxidoreductase [Chloroflexi bacterium]|nr:LLM class flavin-dependent oxidoreductase [Chloroflexota bacterium]